MKTQTLKIVAAFGLMILSTTLFAQSSVMEGGYVLPSMIQAESPFSFTAGGAVEGEVVQIQTIGGEVVARPKADSRGRIFLAAGLGVGFYNLVSGGRSRQFEVKPNMQDLHSRPIPMCVQTELAPMNLRNTFSIRGQGVNPDPSKLAAEFVSRNGPVRMDVLAASPNEVLLAPPVASGIKAGDMGHVQLRDEASGQTAKTGETLAYSAESKLTQKKVPSGAETHLLVMVTPRTLSASIDAEIVSGPVKFANGQNRQTVPLKNGVADFRIQSEPGRQGHFDLNWALSVPEGTVLANLAQDKPAGSRKAGHRIGGGTSNPGGWTDEYTDYDENGNRIGRTSETYDKNGQLIERKTTRNGAKDGDRTVTNESYDKDGKWTGTKTETFEGGKQTGGTQTEPDGKGGKTTKTWDKGTGEYK